jgi:hypothetical protein
MNAKTLFLLTPLLLLMGAESDCDCEGKQSSDDIQRKQQETSLQEGTRQTGMPAIVNFQERKNLKRIIELRDQAKLRTYTYLYNEMQGKLVFFCNSVGFGIPYATQYTNPQKIEYFANRGYLTLPQADPNGLFSPAAADGTWVLCLDAKGENQPVYVEPRVVTSPFPLQ